MNTIEFKTLNLTLSKKKKVHFTEIVYHMTVKWSDNKCMYYIDSRFILAFMQCYLWYDMHETS